MEGARIAARYDSLIRPPDEGMHFTNIHGITWEDVENERLFPDVRDEFARHLESVDYLAAHYAPFDRNVWFALHRRFRLKAPRLAFLCTCQMARQYFRSCEPQTADRRRASGRGFEAPRRALRCPRGGEDHSGADE